MPARPHRLTLSISLALMSLATHAADTQTLPEVVVHGSSTASRAIQADASTLASQQARSNDSARLLETLPGISMRAAGGLSALPVLHGLADDRLLVLTDGMALLAACPNHMNSPLSYLDSSKVGKLVVHSATAPVSTGGDHIGGVIEASQAAPRFAASGETLRSGEIGASYRSNGHAAAIDASATVANDHLSLRYRGDTARAGNYQAARDFKAAGNAASGRGWLEGDEVGSSAYRSENHSIGLAWQNDNHLLEAEAGIQRSPYQGYANQRMDMTGNLATRAACITRGSTTGARWTPGCTHNTCATACSSATTASTCMAATAACRWKPPATPRVAAWRPTLREAGNIN